MDTHAYGPLGREICALLDLETRRLPMEWKVTYQDVPYHYTDPHVLLIEAENLEQAVATACDHLIRSGHAVSGPAYDLRQQGAFDEPKFLAYLGNATLNGKTRIRHCEPYTTGTLGTVRG
jgi:hypothetical protein